MRCFSALLIANLAVVIVSPVSAADGMGSEYADWIRLHLPESSQPEVAEALLVVSEIDARSFDEFLVSFLDELDRTAQEGISKKLPETDSSSRLAHELRLRFVRLVADGVLGRTFKSESLSQSLTPQTPREFSSRATTHAENRIDCLHVEDLVYPVSDRTDTRFLLTSAQPLGP